MRAAAPFSPTRTKLVATIGPATATPARLREILEAGVDVCRLNFSHGKLEDHAAVLKEIRAWSQERQQSVAVLGDLCGPKIRLNEIVGGSVALETGATVQIARGSDAGTAERLTTSHPDLINEVEPGHRLYIDDGLVRLMVTDRRPDALFCTVRAGGIVSSRKGVNVPDTRLKAPALTEKDRRDALWALENGLDYVALSFVRRPADLDELLELLEAAPHERPGVIVKIEKFEALEHLDMLVRRSDGVMVARGDLGVEMDVWQVPLIQKAITARCREAGKPVIVATQMLQSMITSPSPTRAEVSDVANAILDSVDAVMLSAETAAGQFPLASVEMMGLVAQAAESHQRFDSSGGQTQIVDARHPRTSAIAQAAVQAALHLHARLVAAWTATGATVRLIARHRLPLPVVALTYDERVYRQLSLVYGTVPVLVPPISNPVEMSRALDDKLLERGLARAGDLIVVVTSTKPTQTGETDTVHIHRVSAPAGG